MLEGEAKCLDHKTFIEAIQVNYLVHKGTERVIYLTLHAKVAIPNSQRSPGNLYLIRNVGDIVVFLGFKVFNSDMLIL